MVSKKLINAIRIAETNFKRLRNKMVDERENMCDFEIIAYNSRVEDILECLLREVRILKQGTYDDFSYGRCE